MTAGRTIRTPKKGDRLLDKLAKGYSITAACKAEGIGRQSYYDWRNADSAFAAAADEAIESGTDLLEDEAKRRAVGLSGSDTLLIFLLKARRREKYSDKSTVDLNIQVREKAERIAAELGLSVDDVMAEAEAVAAGTWDAWRP